MQENKFRKFSTDLKKSHFPFLSSLKFKRLGQISKKVLRNRQKHWQILASFQKCWRFDVDFSLEKLARTDESGPVLYIASQIFIVVVCFLEIENIVLSFTHTSAFSFISRHEWMLNQFTWHKTLLVRMDYNYWSWRSYPTLIYVLIQWRPAGNNQNSCKKKKTVQFNKWVAREMKRRKKRRMNTCEQLETLLKRNRTIHYLADRKSIE